MENKATGNTLKVIRNKGILGQEILYIKNGQYIWALRAKGENLWGRYSLDEGQTWTDWTTLLSSYNGFFSFTTGGVKKLHLVCKNTQGHLVYICWDEEDITIDILDEEWINEERVTYQTILVNDAGVINLIYFTENHLEGVWRIKHCSKRAGRWDSPEIIDQGFGPGQNQGAAALGPDGFVHLVYQTYAKVKYQFVYREKSPLIQRWGDPVSITDSNRSNLYPCLVIDDQKSLHLTWVRSDGMNYRVVYRRKTKGGWMVGGWQREQYLSPPGVNAYTPTIGVLENEVVVFWQQLQGIYECHSTDEGKVFGKPVLKEQYHKLAYTNLVPLDSFKKHGLNTIATFDTGSTSVALLATIFQNYYEKEQDGSNLNLPEKPGSQELVLPSTEYLSLDYGQKGLGEQLQKISGNFRRLFFETEDVRLTNAQMRETIEENTVTIKQLEKGLSEKEQEVSSLESVGKQLNDSLQQFRLKYKREEKEKQRLGIRLASLEKELAKWPASIAKKDQSMAAYKEQAEKTQQHFKEQITEKTLTISELKEDVKTLKSQLETRKTPLWKQIFR